MRGASCAPAFLFALTAAAAPAPALNVNEIIRRSVAANEADFRAQQAYTYRETERENDGETKTYEVRMLVGSPYNRLVAVNGHPLSPAREKEEDNKMRQTLAKRQQESRGERADRIEKYRKERREERVMLAEMANAFNFTEIGNGTMAGHDVWIFQATPKPGYHPPNQKAKVLTGMRGKLWIEKQGFHWAKVEAEVVAPVYFEGFLARVNPGTRFVLEKTPVSGGFWLPKHFSMNVQAKIVGIFAHNTSDDETYSDYRLAPATVASAGNR